MPRTETSQGRFRTPALLCLLVASSLLIAPPAKALDPRLSLTQYIHTSWLLSEGEQFPNTNSLAQTADGYLWLGTWQGLWRFDGLRLTRWTPPPGETLDEAVLAMTPSSTGGLWIGTRQGLQKLER